MKIFSGFMETEMLEKHLAPVKNIDFSLFIDRPIQSTEELSPINIWYHQEPNMYFGHHDWIIKNQQYFNIVLSSSDTVLNNIPHSIHFHYGNTWLSPEQIKFHEDTSNKQFKLSHLRGKLLKTPGHVLRYEAYDRRNEIKNIPINFYETYGSRYPLEQAIKDKIELFSNSMFAFSIENTNTRGYWVEHICDLLAMKVIPIYWGCSDIEKYIDINGIFHVQNVDDMIYIANNLTEEDYWSRIDAVNNNWNLMLTKGSVSKRLAEKIIEIFKYNNLI